jgi:hypothetical protein
MTLYFINQINAIGMQLITNFLQYLNVKDTSESFQILIMPINLLLRQLAKNMHLYVSAVLCDIPLLIM